MNRAEHLQYSKDRAIEILETSGDLTNVYASFVSDLGKHNELKNHIAIELGVMLMVSGNLSTHNEMKEFINGTN